MIAPKSDAEKNNTTIKTLTNMIQLARRVPITYELIFFGSSVDFCVMLAVVAVEDTIPPRSDESIIDEFEPTNFVSMYQRYETHDIITTKNQIEYGLKKAKLVSAKSNSLPNRKLEISEIENLVSGSNGSITKAIAQNFSVVRSSSFEIYFPSHSNISFDERRNVSSIAKMIAICA